MSSSDDVVVVFHTTPTLYIEDLQLNTISYLDLI